MEKKADKVGQATIHRVILAATASLGRGTEREIIKAVKALNPGISDFRARKTFGDMARQGILVKYRENDTWTYSTLERRF